jgi:hypothetical protein
MHSHMPMHVLSSPPPPTHTHTTSGTSRQPLFWWPRPSLASCFFDCINAHSDSLSQSTSFHTGRWYQYDPLWAHTRVGTVFWLWQAARILALVQWSSDAVALFLCTPPIVVSCQWRSILSNGAAFLAVYPSNLCAGCLYHALTFLFVWCAPQSSASDSCCVYWCAQGMSRCTALLRSRVVSNNTTCPSARASILGLRCLYPHTPLSPSFPGLLALGCLLPHCQY